MPVRAFEPRAARASRQAGGKPCCCSFGIYLVHVPVQTLLKPVAAGIAVMPLRIVVYVALPLAASWALVYFLEKYRRWAGRCFTCGDAMRPRHFTNGAGAWYHEKIPARAAGLHAGKEEK